MPLTILQAHTDERVRVQQQLLDAQQALMTADAALKAADMGVQNATKALALLQAAESTIRQQLAAAQMPGLIDQLETELENNLLLQRPEQARLADAQDQSAVLQLTRQRAAAAVDRSSAQLAQEDAAVTQAAQDNGQAQLWRIALASTVPALIAAAKDPALQSLEDAALARIKRLLGDKQELMDLVSARYVDAAGAQSDRWARRQVAVETLAAVQRTAGGGGAVLATADAYARARERMRAVAENSDSRLAWIELTYRSAVAMPDLAPGEQSRIDTRAAAATTPAQLGAALHTARAAQRSKQTAFALVSEPKMAVDKNFDPATDNSVKTEREAAAQADKDFADADKAYKPNSMQPKIDGWDVAVPPAVALRVSDVLRAQAARGDLTGTKPKDVSDALDNAEAAHAGALVDDIAVRAATEDYSADVAEWTNEIAALAPVADQRIAAAVRGDG